MIFIQERMESMEKHHQFQNVLRNLMSSGNHKDSNTKLDPRQLNFARNTKFSERMQRKLEMEVLILIAFKDFRFISNFVYQVMVVLVVWAAEEGIFSSMNWNGHHVFRFSTAMVRSFQCG